MRQRKVIKTTLGDLIAAIADEVTPIVHDRAGAYLMVSWVLHGLLTRHQGHYHRLQPKCQNS